MKKKLLALFVILLAGTLSGCQLRGFIDRIRFAAEVADFSRVYGDHPRYVMHMESDLTLNYEQSGIPGNLSETTVVDSVVDLSDYYVEAELTSGETSLRYFVFAEGDVKTAYRVEDGNILAAFTVSEGDLATICGCEGDLPATGFGDFDAVSRNEDGSYSQMIDLGADSGFGEDFASSLASSLGVDQGDLDGQTAVVSIAFDVETGVVATTTVLEDLFLEIADTDFLIDATIAIELTFVTDIDRVDLANYFFPLPETTSEIANTVFPNQPFSAYVEANRHVGWIRLDVTAGTYEIQMNYHGGVLPYSVEVHNFNTGMLISGTNLNNFIFQYDGYYLIKVVSSSGFLRFTVTLVPKS